MTFGRSFFALAILTFSNGALAGSLISTNLPSGTTIVNIDGRNDGAAAYGPEQSYWYQPFAQNGNLLELTLGPGTYSFGLIDPQDAQARFPSLTSSQLGTIGGAWTYNTPWVTDYLVFDSSALSDPTQAQLFTGAVLPRAGLPGFGDQGSAYSAAKSNGFADEIVVGTGGRYHGTTATSFTLTATQTLVFAVPDYYLPDNGGTVSVVVQSVPEPASMAAMALGGLAILRRRRQPSTTRS